MCLSVGGAGLRGKTRQITMVLMLPTVTDNGARLAAILPTGLAALAKGLGHDPFDTLAGAIRDANAVHEGRNVPETLPAITSFVLVVVDGLGSANLQAVRAHAPVLSSLSKRRIDTVVPSTTGAALTTLSTGALPGQHGLIGYKIRHPQFGLRNTLNEWEGITDVRSWQLVQPLWGLAEPIGARAVAIGRPAHAVGGLTEAILAGAQYYGGQTIADRFAVASKLLRGDAPILAYVYVDELDRAAHAEGWHSAQWLKRLEALDQALGDFLHALPGGIGVVVTADHGMLDIPTEKRIMLDESLGTLVRDAIVAVGGEPRMRSLYLEDGADSQWIAAQVSEVLGKLAWVGTRDQAIAAGWYGPVAPVVAQRLGDVIVAARSQVAFTLSDDSAASLAMVGQHGGLSSEERGVPLALAGALAGTSFGAAVTQIATSFSI